MELYEQVLEQVAEYLRAVEGLDVFQVVGVDESPCSQMLYGQRAHWIDLDVAYRVREGGAVTSRTLEETSLSDVLVEMAQRQRAH